MLHWGCGAYQVYSNDPSLIFARVVIFDSFVLYAVLKMGQP